MRLLLFFSLVFWATIGLAQDTINADYPIDTTQIFLGKTKILIITDNDDDKQKQPKSTEINNKNDTPKIHKKKKYHNTNSMWSGIQLGVNSYSLLTSHSDSKKYDFLELNHSKNRSVAFNLLSKRLDLGIPYVGLSSGIGIAFNRYALNRNVRLDYDADHIFATTDTINDFTKNYLKTTHITIPILLEFNTHKRAENGFRIAAGLEAGYLIGSKTKIKYKENGKNQVDKSKGNFNMNAFRINLIAMVGYRDISLYAKAAPTEFFENGKGPSGYYHTSFGLLLNFN